MSRPDDGGVFFEGLAEHYVPAASWADVVLPEPQLLQLHDLADRTRQVAVGRPASGMLAFFAGDGGTGKTMAAAALAGSLGLPLYRINLSRVVSKYIGETEKNLSLVFSRTGDTGAILFFDEADALFGKRSEVKDSHDRYANLEINYFLQRAESFRGLVIVASESGEDWAPTVLPRIGFVVHFPPR